MVSGGDVFVPLTAVFINEEALWNVSVCTFWLWACRIQWQHSESAASNVFVSVSRRLFCMFSKDSSSRFL